MTGAAPFRATIDSLAELRTVYREPSPLVIGKERPTIDDATRSFLAHCRFAVVGTVGASGDLDVSPRGGERGFVQVLDDHRLAIADLSGNNRLDTLTNIVETGRIALVFVVPGKTETVRVNGRAWVTIDDEVLDTFTLPKRPKAAIGVEAQTTYMHCGKAFMRGQLWEPTSWEELTTAPDGADILTCQGVVEAEADLVRQHLAEGYEADLAAERA
jgi:PPOX class probable FMN-dependent enzyme